VPRIRTFLRRSLFVIALITILALPVFLVYGGRFLQHEDPLQKADAIFVLAGTRAERALEAVDLYKEGWAPLVVLSPGRLEPAEARLIERGIRFPREADLLRDAIVQLGVPPAAILPTQGYVDNTSEEANLLRAMVLARHWRRVIVVTSKYHTRRSAFAFRRGLENTGAEPIMRASRYDPSDPARWWRRRADLRFAGSEWFKLVYYRLGG
jgi:uncharacterized SAM-binding protein YcdF (DUF218 family)